MHHNKTKEPCGAARMLSIKQKYARRRKREQTSEERWPDEVIWGFCSKGEGGGCAI